MLSAVLREKALYTVVSCDEWLHVITVTDHSEKDTNQALNRHVIGHWLISDSNIIHMYNYKCSNYPCIMQALLVKHMQRSQLSLGRYQLLLQLSYVDLSSCQLHLSRAETLFNIF